MPNASSSRTPHYLLSALLLGLIVVPALKSGAADTASPQAGDPDAGAEVYRNICKECHGGSLAPPLRGVVGRHIASAPDFDYTDALLAKKDMTWTRENLDAFLIDPQDWAPGTEMKKKELTAQNRADVIAYLASLTVAN
ncbi:MAG TPA: c-type cytochrome [Steroidobacteraceae bacterium]|jgi:cytochrome c|nr:c-type cytochrome [Steroidobacteraceae bacterium]